MAKPSAKSIRTGNRAPAPVSYGPCIAGEDVPNSDGQYGGGTNDTRIGRRLSITNNVRAAESVAMVAVRFTLNEMPFNGPVPDDQVGPSLTILGLNQDKRIAAATSGFLIPD